MPACVVASSERWQRPPAAMPALLPASPQAQLPSRPAGSDAAARRAPADRSALPAVRARPATGRLELAGQSAERELTGEDRLQPIQQASPAPEQGHTRSAAPATT